MTPVPQNPGDLLYLASVGDECTQSDGESGRPPGTTAALLAQAIEPPADATPLLRLVAFSGRTI